MGRSPVDQEPTSPRDLALPDVATLERLVARVIEAGRHPAYGDVVTILATTALRISEVSGLRVGDVDLDRGLLQVSRQTYPGRGGLVTKQTKGRRRRTVPVIEPLRPTLARLTVGRSGRPERLHHRVVHRRGDPAHGSQQAGVAQPVAEDPAGV